MPSLRSDLALLDPAPLAGSSSRVPSARPLKVRLEAVESDANGPPPLRHQESGYPARPHVEILMV